MDANGNASSLLILIDGLGHVRWSLPLSVLISYLLHLQDMHRASVSPHLSMNDGIVHRYYMMEGILSVAEDAENFRCGGGLLDYVQILCGNKSSQQKYGLEVPQMKKNT